MDEPVARARGRHWGWIVAVVAASLVSLAGGYLIKNLCTTHQWNGFQYRSSCYNDIYALYHHRGLDEQPWPYVHGNGELEPPGDPGEVGDLEYPVGTGYFVGSVAAVVRDATSFFRTTAFRLGMFGLTAVLAVVMIARDRRRVLYFALAPSLALYAFHNWDLLAVWATAIAFLAYAHRLDAAAGMALGVGAATKLYPGLLAPAFALARWRETRRVPWALLGWSAGAFVAVNLPVLIANPRGWLLPWRFQSTRFPNFETSWYLVYRHLGEGWDFDAYARLTGWLSGALFVAGALVLLWREARRAVVRPYVLAMGLLIVFLLTAKVYSPQYALWLLPLFALVRIRWYGFLAFTITDVAVWYAVAYFFIARQYGIGDDDAWLNVMEVAVVLRYLVLAWILWMSRRAVENVEPAPALG